MSEDHFNSINSINSSEEDSFSSSSESEHQSTIDPFVPPNDEQLRPEINSYTCGICRELMFRPVTLLCQHSYCYGCLETYYYGDPSIPDANYPDIIYFSKKHDKCPVCNIPYTLPPLENTLMAEMLEQKFPEEYEKRRKYIQHEHLLEDKKFEEEQSIRKEIWNSISTNFSHVPQPTPQAQDLRIIAEYDDSWGLNWRRSFRQYGGYMVNRFCDQIPTTLMGIGFFTACMYIGTKITNKQQRP